MRRRLVKGWLTALTGVGGGEKMGSKCSSLPSQSQSPSNTQTRTQTHTNAHMHSGPFHSSLFSMRGLSRLSQCGHKGSLSFGVDSRTAVRTGQKVIRRKCVKEWNWQKKIIIIRRNKKRISVSLKKCWRWNQKRPTKEEEQQSEVDTTFTEKTRMRHVFFGLMQSRVTQGEEMHNNTDYTHMLIMTR